MRLIVKICITSMILFASCHKGPYIKGDRLIKKNNYAEALLAYEKESKDKNLSASQKNVLDFKKARAFYMLGDKTKAFELLNPIDSLPAPNDCKFQNFKLKIFNELSLHEKNVKTINLIERAENSECILSKEELDNFYNNTRKLYYPNRVRKCDKMLIKGNLKRDSNDLFAALTYFKGAVRCNPESEEALEKLLQTMKKITKTIKNKIEKKEVTIFYQHNYPLFFALLSQIYSKNQGKNKKITGRMKQDILNITSSFQISKAANPIPAYSSIEYQNEKNLVKTYRINEIIKVFKIGQSEHLSRYIIISPDDMVIGISAPIPERSFIILD